MAKKSKSKDNEKVLFKDTPEGSSEENFRILCLMDRYFMLHAESIDFHKLYWALMSYSDQGEKYIDWIAAARTFHLNSPSKYQATRKQTANGSEQQLSLNKATGKFIDRSNTAGEIINRIGADNFIPEHLRDNKGSN